TQLLTKQTIPIDLDTSDKTPLITHLLNQFHKAPNLTHPLSFKHPIHNPQSHTTTPIGQRIPIPHPKLPPLKTPPIPFPKSKQPLHYQTLHIQPPHLFFIIPAPEAGTQTHLHP
ncbi:PTS sugar transporter subunit IIA, partial [Staphylococcus epidermidis]|uniref:PTS sugar transporter subunit IIA n=1 Tax=Staphylococcus epidermidis TaxID=1282 RepID=UPI001642A89F